MVTDAPLKSVTAGVPLQTKEKVDALCCREVEKSVLFTYHGNKTSSGAPSKRNHWAVQECTQWYVGGIASCLVLGSVNLLAGKGAPQLPVFCFWDCSSL